MIYCFDLDGTLCTNTFGKYLEAQPFVDAIREVNKLYNEGHTIIIDTARGGTSKINWYEDTKNQLELWGLKYHRLRVGEKIHADLFIDDKAINALNWLDTLKSKEENV